MHIAQNIKSEICFVISCICNMKLLYIFETLVVYAIFPLTFFGCEYAHFFSCSCILKLLNDSWVLIHQHIFHLYIRVLHWASCHKTVHFHVHCMYLLYCTVFFTSYPNTFAHSLAGFESAGMASPLTHINSVVPVFKMIKPAMFHVQFSFHDHFTDFYSCTFDIGLVIGKPACLCTLNHSSSV